MLLPQGSPVGVEQLLDEGFGVLPLRARHDQILDGYDERRVGPETQIAADPGRPLGQHPHTVAGPCLGHDALRTSHLDLAHTLAALLVADPVEEVPDLEVLVPGVEGPPPGRSAHPQSIFLDPRHHDRPPIGRSETSIASSDLETGREPLEIPLPRTGKRLIEVVDVEHHLAFGSAEHTEIRQVSVTAELHGDPRPWRGRQVGRHDQRGAPVERERRDQHPPIPDWDKLATRLSACSSSNAIGSGRSAGRCHRPWVDLGVSLRAAFPRATRSSSVRCARLHADANGRAIGPRSERSDPGPLVIPGRLVALIAPPTTRRPHAGPPPNRADARMRP